MNRVALGPRRIGPVEALEDVLGLLGLHARTVVGHRDHRTGSVAVDRHPGLVPGGVWARTLPRRLSTTWRRLVASPITSIGRVARRR